MEIEHKNWLEAHLDIWESAQNGFIRNLELDTLKMFEHIYRLYLNPTFVLTVWCGSCKMEMITRLYTWFEQQKFEIKDDTIITFVVDEVKPKRKYTKRNG